MDWLINLFTQQNSVAHIVLLFSIVIAVGVLLGKIKICGISLGVTFVLFAGIIAGHVGFTAPVDILTFIQDFGLILFVFMIGLQVGPGFFESFKKGGVTLNLLSTAAVLLNIGVMFACYYLFFDTTDVNNLPMMVGTLYGAVTNTPGLGAANEALTSVFPADKVPSIASGYACAYPLGVLGIIGATIAIRYICKIRLEDENEQLQALENENPHEKPFSMHLKVSNSYLAGKKLQQISEFLNRDIVCSRLLHNGEVVIPNKNTILDLDDEMNIVCAEHDAEAIRAFIGPNIDNPFPEDNDADNPQSYACDIALFGNPRGSGESIWDIKKHIGYVSPELHRSYQRDLPAIRIVASGLMDSVGLYVKPKDEDMDKCRFWMKVFGLEGLEERGFLKLSSGEQRLVLLARAFVKDPELLILDEPLHGLDNYNRRLVKDIIEAFCKRNNKTMIMVTHYKEELPACINHSIFLMRHA